MKELKSIKGSEQKFRTMADKSWRKTLVLAICFSFLLSIEAFAAKSFGVGYYSGPTSGPTVSFSLSGKNSLKLIAPLSFQNVVCDYQYQFKRFSKGRFRFNVYFGVGTDLTLAGQTKDQKKKDEDQDNNNDKNGGDQFAAVLRIPLGISVSMKRLPVGLFAEVVPQVQIYNGSSFGFDQNNIDWKRIGFGARYFF